MGRKIQATARRLEIAAAAARSSDDEMLHAAEYTICDWITFRNVKIPGVCDIMGGDESSRTCASGGGSLFLVGFGRFASKR